MCVSLRPQTARKICCQFADIKYFADLRPQAGVSAVRISLICSRGSSSKGGTRNFSSFRHLQADTARLSRRLPVCRSKQRVNSLNDDSISLHYRHLRFSQARLVAPCPLITAIDIYTQPNNHLHSPATCTRQQYTRVTDRQTTYHDNSRYLQ